MSWGTISLCNKTISVSMDRHQIEHRDRVLRAYFDGRNWDENAEFILKRQLVKHSIQLLPKYPYVIDDEWEVEAGRTDKGKGDLVFTDGNGYFAIVEVKWIDLESTGRTSSSRRTHKRQLVEAQAIDYASSYAQQSSGKVEAFVFTNEDNRPRLLSN
jgi:hypothetical protein